MSKATKICKVVALLIAGIILLTMFVGCKNKTPEECFEDLRSKESVITTYGASALKLNVMDLLEEEGIEVEDLYVSANFSDGNPVIKVRTLQKNGVKTYSVKTECNGPIVSGFLVNSDKVNVYGEIFEIDQFFRDSTYSLKGEEIIVK